MFYHYEIVKENGVDVLYLYLSMKYEFSKELFVKDIDIDRRCKNFIDMNHIPYQGNKVYLVVDGVVVKKVDISKVQRDYLPSIDYSANQYILTIEDSSHSQYEISLKEYLISILFSYYHPSISKEVLKAICVLFNTYSYKMMEEYSKIDEKNDFCIFQPLSYYQEIYSNYSELASYLESIIQEVDGVFLQYENEYIYPFIHYSNSGITYSHPKYPYLSAVKSFWDMVSPTYINYVDYSYSDLENYLKIDISALSKVEIKGNHLQRKIVIDNHIFSGEEFKSILHLNSLDFYVILYKDTMRILSFGKGNGYGLSIFGSNEISKNGGNYQNILNYYFPKVKLYRHIQKGLL